MLTPLRLLKSLARHVFADRANLLLENLALRHQLAVYQRHQIRPLLGQRDRLLWSLLARVWPRWRDSLVMVQLATVVSWHRSSWKRYWTFRSRGRPGRPRISVEVRDLIVRMAKENPRWGTQRIRGELLGLGFDVGAETIRRYRHRARGRGPSQSWRTFLHNHRPQLWACDCFTVQTLTFKTLFVFFFIDHGRRVVLHYNVTAHPTAAWVWRQLIQATPWGQQPRYLIRDRNACFGSDFVARAGRLGIKTILSPYRSPKANAIAERMVGTFRRECFDHLIVINERHVRRVLTEFVDHYNRARPHRTLALVPPLEPVLRVKPPEAANVTLRPVLGGLHHEYRWEAA